jgi:Site-specific recombinases, DNA invertase Pin homologs
MPQPTIPFELGTSVVAYLRDSGGDDQDLSVAQQSIQIREWAEKNHLFLSRIFADEATPGSTTVGRVAFAEMIAHFHRQDHQDKGVVLWKYSRFSRDIDDAQFFKADLRRRGIVIYSLNDNIPESIDGRIMEALIDWMNARFLEDLSVDVRRGLQHNFKQYGAMPGFPPRGFKRETRDIGSRRDGSPHSISRWVPDPLWWERCKQAWKMRASGISIHEIHRQLHLFKSLSSYTTFFTNRLYLGELKYGETTIQNYTEAMITQEEWDLVQADHLVNSEIHKPSPKQKVLNHPRRSGSSFLLSGLLFCPYCGSPMNGTIIPTKAGKRLRYYHCRNAKQRQGCTSKRIPSGSIDEIVLKSLREYILDPTLIAERDKEFILDHVGNLDLLMDEKKRATAERQEIQRKIINLTSRIADDPDAPKSLDTMLRDLEGQEKLKSAEIDRFQSSMNREKVFIGSPQEYARVSEAALLELSSDDPKRIKLILNSLIQRVVAERDGDMVRGMITFYNPVVEKQSSSEDSENRPTTTNPRGGTGSHRSLGGFRLKPPYPSRV